MKRTMRTAVLASLLAVSACGGGGGGSNAINPGSNGGNGGAGGGNNGWIAGVFKPSSTFENLCATPRTGNDTSGQPFPDRKGTVTDENNWLRSWTNELYLWYSEVQDRNPASYTDALDYFDLLKTTATTASGASKDKFHFTYPTAEWEALSQSGVSAGYGANFAILSGTPPRRVVVALVEAGSPAQGAGLLRGDEILTVDGVDVANGSNVNVLNAGLFPSVLNQSHTFQIRSGGTPRTITMSSRNVTSTPVHTVATLPTASGAVGYILFNDHIATAETGLMNAVTQLKSQNIVDLVLDIRYNGGGYLDLASELAYMIAGSSRTAGQTFERIAFNDKHTATDPVTGEALTPTPFHTKTVGLPGANAAGVNLPTLNLDRVFVLTTDGTCSASEAIINGLRGVGVNVIQIGTTTCGKPYGFYPFDNCGTTYFSIQFKGVNAQNFGDYSDGFTPSNTLAAGGERVTGCSVADDFTRQLGDPIERMLSVALNYRMSGACSSPPAAVAPRLLAKSEAAVDEALALHRPAIREMRLYRPSAQ